jgi:hypothetical protein
MTSDPVIAAVAAARSLVTASPVVLVFANAAYADILVNWLSFARRAGAGANVLVAALDAETTRIATTHAVAFFRMPPAASPADMWIARAELFSGLARAGVDFIHSDADAIWLRSPLEEMSSLDVDIAFSSGTVWPRTAVAKWGFVACCGFFAARATTATAAFFAEVAARARICGDDQVAVNEALMAMAARWDDHVPADRRTYEGVPFRVFAEPVIGRAGDLRVALLPHRRFPRLPELSRETVVAHPIAPWINGRTEGAERPARVLRSLGLWEMNAEAPAA